MSYKRLATNCDTLDQYTLERALYVNVACRFQAPHCRKCRTLEPELLSLSGGLQHLLSV